MFRIGIQRKIPTTFDELIKLIYNVTNYGVIIEFAMPRERYLSLPEITKFKNNFSINELEKALAVNFNNYKNLGKCEHVSGNKFGRYMFYALKDGELINENSS